MQLHELCAKCAYNDETCSMCSGCHGENHTPKHALLLVESLKNRIILLRVELRDALMMAYGHEMNWPKSARDLLETKNENR